MRLKDQVRELRRELYELRRDVMRLRNPSILSVGDKIIRAPYDDSPTGIVTRAIFEYQPAYTDEDGSYGEWHTWRYKAIFDGENQEVEIYLPNVKLV
jgi:hypothetical protein